MFCLKFEATPRLLPHSRIDHVAASMYARRPPRLAWSSQAARVLLCAAILGGMTALAGCVTTKLPPLSPPAPAAWRHAQPADAPTVDLRSWWHAFHDSRLDALVDLALRDNLSVAAAQEHLLAARATMRSAYAPYLPGVRAKTEDAVDPDASASFFVAGFDASWELPLFGRGTAGRRQARGNFDASVADLQTVRVSLVGDVVRSWLELRSATHRKQLLVAIRNARQQQLDLLHVRHTLKLTTPSSIVQAEVALARAAAAMDESQQLIDTSSQSLATLLGRNQPDPTWLQRDNVPDLGAWQLASTPADLLRTRPEIARAQADVLSAAGDAGMARADMYPSVGIGGSIVWSTNLTTHRRTNDNAIASAGPILNIPLFDWGLRQSRSHAKNHELKAAVFAYRQAVLEGVSEVENALGALEQQRLQEHHSRVVATALAREHVAVSERVRLGLDSPLDQLDSAVASDEARLQGIQTRTARGLAFVSLYKALGGAPLPDDVNVATEGWR
ncbi:MAG: TolC family protein [Pseudomonadota bacterium]|nr:TolC family protein [Pseudomonadota bacterium]